MNPSRKKGVGPFKPKSWSKWRQVLGDSTPNEAINFVARLLNYDPKKRPKPLEALLDPFFDVLRAKDTHLVSLYGRVNNKPMPDLFNFNEEELKDDPMLCS